MCSASRLEARFNHDEASALAPTAQPTMPSSQWLSEASGRSFHSSTTRPRPSVAPRSLASARYARIA